MEVDICMRVGESSVQGGETGRPWSKLTTPRGFDYSNASVVFYACFSQMQLKY